MEAFDLLCVKIALVYLVVVISLMYLLIHILKKMSSIVGPSRYHLSAEESRKRGFNHSDCPFCIRVALYRSIGVYVVKMCRSSHMDHVVNISSIVGHVRFEADLSIDERGQLANFGKIGYTSLQSKTALCRLFSNRAYDPNMFIVS